MSHLGKTLWRFVGFEEVLCSSLTIYPGFRQEASETRRCHPPAVTAGGAEREGYTQDTTSALTCPACPGLLYSACRKDCAPKGVLWPVMVVKWYITNDLTSE